MKTAAQPHAAALSAQNTSSRATPVAPPMMKAIVHDHYGSPDLLGIREVARPVPGANEVRVRVHASGLHVGDCFSVRGAPIIVRMFTGLLKPKVGIPGFDVAGYIDAVGSNVERFQVGDEVFGACTTGSCAEYVCTPQDQLVLKPTNLTLEQAAALPTSALAALHALRDVAKIQPGQTLLINGASGGVGTFAVQIAKSFGAEVTGVCSSASMDMVRSIGADHVIDYTQEDFARGGKRYDFIFDNVENRSLADCRRALAPRGTLILNSGTGASGLRMMVRLLEPIVLSPFIRQNLRRYLSTPNQEDLVVLKELVEAGKLEPVIDTIYPLLETPLALEHIEGGHVRGKVVVTI